MTRALAAAILAAWCFLHCAVAGRKIERAAANLTPTTPTESPTR